MTITMEQIQEKTDAINLLLNDNNSRPPTKEEYIALLEQLQSERNALIAQKNAEDEAAITSAEQARIAYEASNEYKLVLLDAEYDPQFQSLQSAYNGAVILNDTASIADIRGEYQALLAEYNAKKERFL